MTSSPYDKTQVFYSINPSEDSHVTNYFIFPDFVNIDPLCAITERKAVVCSTVCAGMVVNPATDPTALTAPTGMDLTAIPEYNPGWWQFKMNER